MTDSWDVLSDLWYIMADLWIFIVYIDYYFVCLAATFLASVNIFITISVTTSFVTESVYQFFALSGHISFSQ